MAIVHRDAGAAHNGLETWYWQRLSAVALILLLPLAYILLLCLLCGDTSQMALLDILDHPFIRSLHSLLMLALLVHAYIGIRIIVEDYVPLGIRLPLLEGLLAAVAGTGFWWMSLIWAWGI